MKRLFQILFRDYKFHLLAVVAGIIGSAVASVRGTLFMQTLIDDYIVPLIGCCPWHRARDLKR